MDSRGRWLLNCAFLLVGLGLAYWSWRLSQQAVIVVQWTTASELNTVGFNILRSDNPAGPFIRVNSNLITGAADALTGAAYEFNDPEVQPGKKYFYLLEDVDETGASNRHGPIEAEAKGGGKAEFALALACCTIALVGMARSISDRLMAKNPPIDRIETSQQASPQSEHDHE